MTINSEYSLAYSKEVKQAPPTSLKLGPKPCRDPKQQANSFWRRDNHYPTEIMKGVCLNDETDNRYTESGFITNEYDMMEANGIYRML